MLLRFGFSFGFIRIVPKKTTETFLEWYRLSFCLNLCNFTFKGKSSHGDSPMDVDKRQHGSEKVKKRRKSASDILQDLLKKR